MTGTKTPTERAKSIPGFIVQPRDKVMLREIGIMRVAEGAHVKIAAGFGSTSRVNARLLGLVRAGLLRRFFLGSGGGRKALYALSEKGAHFIGVPRLGPRRKQDAMLVADFFIQHQLSINNMYCDLKFGASPVPDATFNNWQAFYCTIMPGKGLIPDGYIEFVTPAGIDASFIEVDLGHESLAIWKDKAEHYKGFALSEDFKKQFHQAHFRVLVLANSERRLQSIRKTVATVTRKIFWFATLDVVRGEQFFGPVWQRPTGDERRPFFTQMP